MLEALNLTEARKFAGLPSDLLQKEFKLRQAITALKDERYEENQNADDNIEAITSTLDSKIFDLQRDYDQLVALFEKEISQLFFN